MTTLENEMIQTCYKHPNRQTLIRCNQCDRPICLDCAVSTPTGYRCKECIHLQQKRFNNSIPRDYFFAGAISLILGAIGSFLLYWLNFSSLITAILLGIGLGTLIVKLVRYVTQKRRSKDLNQVTAIAAGIGGAVPILQYILRFFQMLFIGNYGSLPAYTISVGWGVLYIAVLCGTILTNMRGFFLKKR